MSLSVQTEINSNAVKRFDHPVDGDRRQSDCAEHDPDNTNAQRRQYGPILALSIVGSMAILPLTLPAVLAVPSAPAVYILLAAACIHIAALGLFSVMGRTRDGAMVSIVGFVGLLSWSVAQTGGFSSPLIGLFACAPVEAYLTGRRWFVRTVSLLTLAGLAMSASLSMVLEVVSQIQPIEIMLYATLGILYALSVAVRIVRANQFRDLQAQATRRAIQQLHHVTHDVFLVIERDGVVGQVFGAVRAVLDCDGSDLEGTGLFDRVHVSDRPSLLSALDDVHTRSDRATVEVRVKAGGTGSSQHFLWAEIDLSIAQSAQGQREIFALVRDVTAAKDQANVLMQAREKAEASDAAKGRFLATMSHELRTPLNAIIGFADILNEEVFGALANEQQREYVTLIRDSGGHLLQLVNDLLDMSKLDAGHFQILAEPFNLEKVIDRCTRLVGQQIEQAGLELRLDIPDDLPDLVADQRAVRQMLINLLSNACKFTPGGGRVTIRARQDGPMMVLTVSDTGIGIAAQDLPKIGQPFFQANIAYDRDHQGTGLGLSVVNGLCELHEGSLKVRSTEGEGTSVSICLPFSGPKNLPEPTHGAEMAANAVVLAKLDGQRTRSQQQHDEVALDAALEAQDTPIFEQEGKRAHG